MGSVEHLKSAEAVVVGAEGGEVGRVLGEGVGVFTAAGRAADHVHGGARVFVGRSGAVLHPEAVERPETLVVVLVRTKVDVHAVFVQQRLQPEAFIGADSVAHFTENIIL